MEMISEIMLAGTVLAVGGGVMHGIWKVRRARFEAQVEEMKKAIPLNLRDGLVRERMERMLEQYGITGDADIRDGRVLTPPDTDKLHPLLNKVLNAVSFGGRLRNPAASQVYIRDSMGDRFLPLADLDLDDLRDLAEIIRHYKARMAA